jgi:hypothetical protein
VYETASVRDAMEQAIPLGYTLKSKFPPWFSNALRYYNVKEKYFYRRLKKKRSDYFYDKFALYRKLVKNTIKYDRLRWLKSINNNIKSQPQHFWKYVSNFRKY